MQIVGFSKIHHIPEHCDLNHHYENHTSQCYFQKLTYARCHQLAREQCTGHLLVQRYNLIDLSPTNKLSLG